MRILLLGPSWRNDPIAAFLTERGNSVTCANVPIDVKTVEKQQIEFIISSGYGPIIRKPVIDAVYGKVINLHATFLPYGKGIGTTFFSVFEGTPTGVSIHYIEPTIDTGPVLARRPLPYEPEDTLRSFYNKLLAATARLFYELWDDIAAGRISATPQKEFGITVPYRSRLDSERWMDLLPDKWDTPLEKIANMGADFRLSQAFWEEYEKRTHSD